MSHPQSITQPPGETSTPRTAVFLTDEELDALYPPVQWSGVTRGLRADLDGGVATVCQAGCSGGPEPRCVAPAAEGFPDCQQSPPRTPEQTVKGRGAPHSSGNGAAAAAEPLDLTLPHISPRENLPVPNVISAELQIAIGGSFARLKYSGNPPPPMGGKKRGAIQGYSLDSRGRLIDTFNRLDRRELCRPLFAGLTYPPVWESSPRVWKRQIQALWKRIERKYGEFPAFWKLEFQARGAPHFHLLLFYPGRIPWQWLSAAWNAIVAPGDAAHLKSWGRIERARTWNGVMSYVSLYLGKHVAPGDCPEGTGRMWGVWNKDMLHIHEVTYDMTLQSSWKVRRVMRTIQRKRGYKTRTRSKFAGTKVYIVEGEARRLLAFIEPEPVIPYGAHDVPLWPEGVEPTGEWETHMLAWWGRRRRKHRTLQEIAASFDAQPPP